MPPTPRSGTFASPWSPEHLQADSTSHAPDSSQPSSWATRATRHGGSVVLLSAEELGAARLATSCTARPRRSVAHTRRQDSGSPVQPVVDPGRPGSKARPCRVSRRWRSGPCSTSTRSPCSPGRPSARCRSDLQQRYTEFARLPAGEVEVGPGLSSSGGYSAIDVLERGLSRTRRRERPVGSRRTETCRSARFSLRRRRHARAADKSQRAVLPVAPSQWSSGAGAPARTG